MIFSAANKYWRSSELIYTDWLNHRTNFLIFDYYNFYNFSVQDHMISTWPKSEPKVEHSRLVIRDQGKLSHDSQRFLSSFLGDWFNEKYGNSDAGSIDMMVLGS